MLYHFDQTPSIDGSRPAAAGCPICEETRRSYLFVIRGLPVVGCPGCGLISLYPQPDPTECLAFYGTEAGADDPRLRYTDSETERDACGRYLQVLAERGARGGRVLLVAPPGHPFVAQATAAGYTIAVHRSVTECEQEEDLGADYDVAVVLHQLEKAAAPLGLLQRVHQALRPGGVLLVTAPSNDSWPASFFGDRWTEWRPENRFYFGSTTMQLILLKSGFAEVWIEPDARLYTLNHIRDRAAGFPRTNLTRSITYLHRFMPSPVRQMRLRLSTSGIIVTATRAAVRRRPLCSIVLPAYNEGKTFSKLMDSLLAQELPGIDREIIVVESNSTDETRQLARGYEAHPEVRLVLEDRPRGKGHAVRTGFRHARGDIVLIQDADLEYDLNDYPALLQPLLSHRALFVLGARHGGHWKMRHFSDQPGMSSMLNLGHCFFTTLLNVLFRQRMRDPFTMFKVFRRDCLYGLEFHCNRFDFDHELVIKFVRKGYTPLEIPVNYTSRSFKEGKKVSLIRDPLSWLWVNFKLRFTRLRRCPAA